MRCLAAVVIGCATSVAATTFLNHTEILAGLEDPAWFEANVPILDIPNAQIQQIYYFRWTTHREHYFYTGAQFGYMQTEFLGPTGYSAPYYGINAAAGHHISEGRWLRNQEYGENVVNYWLSGPGQWPKPADSTYNPDTSDWAHEYSFWAASSVWRQYLVTGNKDFATGQLDNLVTQYENWGNHYNSSLGLYWQAPVWDATEYSVASYESSDPYHGGYGYRPTINSYQYGDASAISAIAALQGNTALSSTYAAKASALQQAQQSQLWDSSQQFYEHMARDDNPTDALLGTREFIGFIPWYFDMPSGSEWSVAWSQLTDPQGFSGTYGPTTAENRSSLFMYQAYDGCCRWDGPVWPYATALVLGGVENLLNNYPSQSYITASDYYELLLQYALTQFTDGQPDVREAYDPYYADWIYNSTSDQDYNHSTFVDNVLAGLIGLRAQSDSSLVVNPLVPSTWTYFGLENAAYHGHNITVLWDQTGSHYGQGQGLRVWVDNQLAGQRTSLGNLTVSVGAAISPVISSNVNIAANGLQLAQLTQPNASYTSGYGGDSMWHAIDGMVFRYGIPENSRWTTYASPNPSDWFSIDLRQQQAISMVSLYFYIDNQGVLAPSSYDLQYEAADGSWTTVPNQSREGVLTVNAQISITFPQITTSKLRVVAPNGGNSIGWGLSEFEVWTAPIFQLYNVNSQKLMGVEDESTASGALIQQYESNGTPDHLWTLQSVQGGWWQIVNYNSGKLLDVQNASLANSTNLVQNSVDGASSQLWRLQDASATGQFLIINQNSGLVAGVTDESTENSADVVQYANTGTPDHLWELLPATSV